MTKMRTQQKGFTLLEVLIAMVVLSIGLLGVAGMQANSLRNNHNAFIKTQASNLAADLADRMRANKSVKDNYVFDTDDGVTAAPTCISTGCTPAQMATYDIAMWSDQFTRDEKPILPDGRGVTSINGNTVTINILWTDLQYGTGQTIDDPNANCPDTIKAANTACFSMSFNL